MSSDQFLGIDRAGDHDSNGDHETNRGMPSRAGGRLSPADQAVSDDEARDALASAAAVLESACPGWRRNRRCVDEHGNRLAHPHPMCLHAQHRHYMILLEHGLTIPARRPSGASPTGDDVVNGAS